MARSSRIVLLSLVFCSACLRPAIAQTDKSPDKLLLEFGPSVVTVVSYSSAGTLIHFGSGFLLPDGRIVTTAHVLNAAVRVDVIDWEGRVLGSAFHVEALGLGEDLSILPAPASAKHGLTLSTGVPEPGSPVLVMGSDKGLKGKLTKGVVREVERTEARGSIQISAPLSEDLLGGPVLDSLGEVVGVAVAIHEEDGTLGRVVPSADVAALAAGAAGAFPFPGGPGERGETEAEGSSLNALPIAQERLPEKLAQADPLTPDKDAAGIFTAREVREGGGGAFDFFRFQGLAGQAITIDARSLSGKLDLSLHLIPPACGSGQDCDGVVRENDGGEGRNAQLSLALPEDGAYLVVVGGPEGETGSYTVRLSHGLTAPVVEAPPAASSADRWVKVGEAETFTIFLDVESVTRSTAMVSAWFSWRYAELQEDEAGAYESMELFMNVRCGSNEVRILRVDRILGEERRTSSGPPGEWQYVPPRSVGSGQITEACLRAHGR